MIEDADDSVQIGPPESWEDFADRCARQMGKGARAFYCKQVGGDPNAPGFVMVLVPGPTRGDLLRDVAAAVVLDKPAAGA